MRAMSDQGVVYIKKQEGKTDREDTAGMPPQESVSFRKALNKGHSMLVNKDIKISESIEKILTSSNRNELLKEFLERSVEKFGANMESETLREILAANKFSEEQGLELLPLHLKALLEKKLTEVTQKNLHTEKKADE
jgi:hypothetical protein